MIIKDYKPLIEDIQTEIKRAVIIAPLFVRIEEGKHDNLFYYKYDFIKAFYNGDISHNEIFYTEELNINKYIKIIFVKLNEKPNQINKLLEGNRAIIKGSFIKEFSKRHNKNADYQKARKTSLEYFYLKEFYRQERAFYINEIERDFKRHKINKYTNLKDALNMLNHNKLLLFKYRIFEEEDKRAVTHYFKCLNSHNKYEILGILNEQFKIKQPLTITFIDVEIAYQKRFNKWRNRLQYRDYYERLKNQYIAEGLGIDQATIKANEEIKTKSLKDIREQEQPIAK